MLVGNVYYVTNSYNETKFKALLEKQLAKNSATLPSAEFTEQVIAAYLACEDAGISDTAISLFKIHLNSMKYQDNRSYCGDKVVGDPLDAVRAYNQLIVMYQLR